MSEQRAWRVHYTRAKAQIRWSDRRLLRPSGRKGELRDIQDGLLLRFRARRIARLQCASILRA